MRWTATPHGVAEPVVQRNKLLRDARLRLGTTVTEDDLDAIHIETEPPITTPLAVEFGKWECEASLDESLVCVSRPEHLKRFEAFFKCPLHEFPEIVEVPNTLRNTLGVLAGLEIGIFITSQAGGANSIIARRIFRIIRDFGGFHINHVWLSDERWVHERNLPRRTAWALGEPDFSSTAQDIVVYLHERLQEPLNSSDNDLRHYISLQLATDILCDLIVKFVDEGLDSIPGTLGAAVKQRMEENEISTTDAAHANIQTLRAKVQNMVGLVK